MNVGRTTPGGSAAPSSPADELTAVRIGAVAVGAVVGSAIRWILDSWIDGDPGGIAPALLVANVVGAFVLGVTVGLSDDDGRRRTAVGVGLCGGMTSFSAWSVMIAEALEGGRSADATTLVLAHLVGGFAAFIAARSATTRLRRWAGPAVGRAE